MKQPRRGTVLFSIYTLMEKSIIEKRQIEVPKLTSKFGEVVKRSTVSMCINKLNPDYFKEFNFYTRTINDQLYIGTIEHLKNE